MAMLLTFARTSRRSRIKQLSFYQPYKCLSSSASVTSEPSSSVITNNDPSNSISPINTCLALSVHFRHPDLGMKDYEILSRATAFLLQVDPPDSENETDFPSTAGDSSKSHDAKGYVKKSAFPHLKENINLRKKLLEQQQYKYDPATGPRRHAHQLNWLEFCPHNFRPKVHVMASSHVISPWLWPKYYGQDWLRVITQEHVRYSLEVWGEKPSDKSDGAEEMIMSHDGKLKGTYEPLAKFALNPYPIHHPKDMDVAIIHLKEEDAAVQLLTKLGVQPLHLPTMHELETSNDPVFEPGERVLFQGFEVYEENATDQETVLSNDDESKKKSEGEDDKRMFHPYSSLGTLAMASPDRFLAQTAKAGGPLPEGLCGGPVIQFPSENTNTVDNNNNTKNAALLTICGVVEGIVPTNHENQQLAGLASFLPQYRIREFVDFAERIMLEQIIDKDLFEKVVDMKERKNDHRGTTTFTGRQEGDVHELNVDDAIDSNKSNKDDDDEAADDPNIRIGLEGTSEEGTDTPQIDREYQDIVAQIRENHTPEEVDAILATVEREREEVIKIMDNDEGADVDDVIADVRRKTYEEKDRIMKEIEMEMMGQKNIVEGEIVDSKADEKP